MLTQSVSRRGGGTFEVLRDLTAALHHPPDLDIRVFGLEDNATAEDLDAWGVVPIDVSAVRGPRSFGYAPALGPKIAAAEVDLLHVHGLWMFTSIAARLWSSGRSASYLVSPHGMLDPWALRRGGWKKRIASGLYEFGHLRRAACLHALCNAEYEAIRAFGLRNPVCIIPNGVKPAYRHSKLSASWRKELPADRKVLLYLGRLHPKKGLAELLGGWSEITQVGVGAARKWHLVIAGWDQDGHRASLERIVSRGNLGNTVRFVGAQFGAEKAATFAAADAFILPSLSEGLPVAVLEAWAYGLPVLMTPQCNLPEGFTGGAALPIEASPQRIAAQLGVLFAMSDDRRHELGMRGLELSQTRFDWGRIATQLTSVYRWICGVEDRPSCVQLA